MVTQKMLRTKITEKKTNEYHEKSSLIIFLSRQKNHYEYGIHLFAWFHSIKWLMKKILDILRRIVCTELYDLNH